MLELELVLELGRSEPVVCLAVSVCPGIEIDKMGMQSRKGNSFAVRRWQPAVGMPQVRRMSSSALYCSKAGPIEDRLAVAVGTQAVVASTVVGH